MFSHLRISQLYPRLAATTLLLFLVGCDIFALSSALVKADDTVSITGINLKSNMKLTLDDAPLELSKQSAKEIAFEFPASNSSKVVELKIFHNDVLISRHKLLQPEENLNSVSELAADLVCTGVSFSNISGETLLGSKNCVTDGVAPTCSKEGEVDCLTTSDFPAIDRAKVEESLPLVRSTVSIAGVTGKAQDCRLSEQGCYLPLYAPIAQPLKAIDPSEILSFKIKAGEKFYTHSLR